MSAQFKAFHELRSCAPLPEIRSKFLSCFFLEILGRDLSMDLEQLAALEAD
jgi:hypothetical protein